jgi:general secretion pathway protein J
MTAPHYITIRRRAFTLLEVLLAAAVFAILLLSIHGVFYGAWRLRDKTVKTLEAALPMQQTLTIIKRDIANIVVPGGTFFGELQTTPTTNVVSGQLGQNSTTPGVGAILQGLASPVFYTASGIIDDDLPWGEVEKVFYYLANPTNDARGKDLFRSVTRNLLPTIQEQADEQWLISGVQSIFFTFYDGTQWLESWDSTTAPSKLPEAVKMQIRLVPEETDRVTPEPVELVVPLAVQASTNQVTQTTGETE